MSDAPQLDHSHFSAAQNSPAPPTMTIGSLPDWKVSPSCYPSAHRSKFRSPDRSQHFQTAELPDALHSFRKVRMLSALSTKELPSPRRQATKSPAASQSTSGVEPAAPNLDALLPRRPSRISQARANRRRVSSRLLPISPHANPRAYPCNSDIACPHLSPARATRRAAIVEARLPVAPADPARSPPSPTAGNCAGTDVCPSTFPPIQLRRSKYPFGDPPPRPAPAPVTCTPPFPQSQRFAKKFPRSALTPDRSPPPSAHHGSSE